MQGQCVGGGSWGACMAVMVLCKWHDDEICGSRCYRRHVGLGNGAIWQVGSILDEITCTVTQACVHCSEGHGWVGQCWRTPREWKQVETSSSDDVCVCGGVPRQQ
jgi:hypothetical protein